MSVIKVQRLVHGTNPYFTGIPSSNCRQPSSKTVDKVNWKPSTGFPLDYMRIGNHGQPEKSIVGMESGLFEDRVNLWRKLKTGNDDTKL